MATNEAHILLPPPCSRANNHAPFTLLALLIIAAIFGKMTKKKRERGETGNWENDSLSEREVANFKRQMCYTDVASGATEQQHGSAAAPAASRIGVPKATKAKGGLVTKLHSFASLVPTTGGNAQRQLGSRPADGPVRLPAPSSATCCATPLLALTEFIAPLQSSVTALARSQAARKEAQKQEALRAQKKLESRERIRLRMEQQQERKNLEAEHAAEQVRKEQKVAAMEAKRLAREKREKA